MGIPYFPFYPGDYRANSNLRRCSLAARGAWIEALCLMHDSKEYGVLRWPLKEIATAIGAPLAVLAELVAKEVMKGAESHGEPYIFTPTHAGKNGDPVELVKMDAGPCYYSSRMVRDGWVRMRRGSGTRFGAVKDTPKPTPKPPLGDGSGDGLSASYSFSDSAAAGASSSPATGEAAAAAEVLGSCGQRGIDPTTATWADEHYAPEVIHQALAAFDERQKKQSIGNPSGLFRKMLTEGFSSPKSRVTRGYEAAKTATTSHKKSTSDEEAAELIRVDKERKAKVYGTGEKNSSRAKMTAGATGTH